MRLVRTASLLALVAVAGGKRREDPATLVAKRAIAVAHTHGCELRAEILPELPRFSLDEPGYVAFRVTTECAEPLKMLIVADSGNELRRPNSYRVSAVDAKGASVRAIDVANDQGGGQGLRELGRERPFEQQLVLANWLAFTAPGRYELTVQRTLSVGRSREDLEPVPLKVSTPIEITP